MVTEPAFHVSRNMEDFVTWVDSSKIRRKVQKYNDAVDDFVFPPPLNNAVDGYRGASPTKKRPSP